MSDPEVNDTMDSDGQTVAYQSTSPSIDPYAPTGVQLNTVGDWIWGPLKVIHEIYRCSRYPPLPHYSKTNRFKDPLFENTWLAAIHKVDSDFLIGFSVVYPAQADMFGLQNLRRKELSIILRHENTDVKLDHLKPSASLTEYVEGMLTLFDNPDSWEPKDDIPEMTEHVHSVLNDPETYIVMRQIVVEAITPPDYTEDWW